MHRRSFSQYPIANLSGFTPQKLQVAPQPPSLQETVQSLDSDLTLLTSCNLPKALHSFKLSKVLASVQSFKLQLRQLELAKQETVSKYEGKIAYIEEELVDNERKNYMLKDKIRVLTGQLSQMRDEYNQLSEDFNSTMQLLKEQMASREQAIDDEEDKIYKLNSLIKSLNEEVANKEEELTSLREALEKRSKTRTEHVEDPLQALEHLEKKYKSLETLYTQQMLKNTTLQDLVLELETKVKTLEDKAKDYESQIRTLKVSKDSSFADVSQGSLSETDQSTQKVSWRFEATQLQNKVNDYKVEISRLSKQTEDYKFEIILLHNKVAGLQAQLSNKDSNPTINEVSEQLRSDDYDLTGTLEANNSLKAQLVLQTIVEDNYAELAKIAIVNNLVSTEHTSDYEILQKTVETLVKIREILLNHSEIKREKPDLPKDLQMFIDTKIADHSYENRTIQCKTSRNEEIDFQNYTEPSPRATARTAGPNFVADVKAKLLAKKKIILLHKEQILCLKKQLREVEANLKTFQKLDIEMLKSLVLRLFEMVPKIDEKTEKEVEICLDLLGFGHEQYLGLKNARAKKSKFRLFG